MQARDDVARLEAAMLARAGSLGEEYRRQAQQGRQRVRVDNSFEGRIERFGETLYQVVLDHLFPSSLALGGQGNGG